MLPRHGQKRARLGLALPKVPGSKAAFTYVYVFLNTETRNDGLFSYVIALPFIYIYMSLSLHSSAVGGFPIRRNFGNCLRAENVRGRRKISSQKRKNIVKILKTLCFPIKTKC